MSENCQHRAFRAGYDPIPRRWSALGVDHSALLLVRRGNRSWAALVTGDSTRSGWPTREESLKTIVRCIFALVLCVALTGTVLHADDRPERGCSLPDCMGIGREFVKPRFVSLGPSICSITMQIEIVLPPGTGPVGGTFSLSLPRCPSWAIYQPGYFQQVGKPGYCICTADEPRDAHMVNQIRQEFECDYEWLNECLPIGVPEDQDVFEWTYHEFICF